MEFPVGDSFTLKNAYTLCQVNADGEYFDEVNEYYTKNSVIMSIVYARNIINNITASDHDITEQTMISRKFNTIITQMKLSKLDDLVT